MKSQDENAAIVNEKPKVSDPKTEKTAEGYATPQEGATTQPGQPAPAGPPTDWNPNAKPADGSPVKTVVDRHGKPASGQSGYKPDTVDEHNAKVDEESDKA